MFRLDLHTVGSELVQYTDTASVLFKPLKYQKINC